MTVIILFYSFQNIATREIHKKSIDLLIQSQKVFSSLHEWIIPSFRQVNSESAISNLVNSDRLDKITISAGIDRLEDVIASYYMLHSIYIYNHQMKEYFSTINGYEGRDCSDFNLSDIIHNIRQYGVYRYIPRKITYRISDNVFRPDLAKVETENVFSIVIGDMPQTAPTIKGALIVNINEEKIRNNFLATNTNTREGLIVIDKKGFVLTHPDESRFGEDFSQYSYIKKVLHSKQNQGILIDKIEGTKYLISYAIHPLWGWRFINVMPYEKIFSDLKDFLNIAIIVFLLLMLFTIILAFFSSLRIYSPIHKLSQFSLSFKEKLKDQDLTSSKTRLSEVQYLDRVFKQIIKRADTYDNYLQEHKEIYKNRAIRGLLLGELDSDELGNYWEFIQSDIETGPFILAVLRFDRFNHFFETLQPQEITKLYNIIRELVSHYLPLCKLFLPLNRDHICIICKLNSIPDDQDSQFEKIKVSLKNLQAAIHSQLHYTITIGLSNVFSDYADFHEKYKLSFQATQFRFRYGYNTLICNKDLYSSINRNYIFPEEKLKTLFDELKLGKLSRVEKCLNEILEQVKEYDYEDFVYMVQFITYQTNKFIEKLKKSLDQSYINLKGLIQKIKAADTIEEVKNNLAEIYTLVYEILQNKHSNKIENLANKVKECINKHFNDINLCSDSLADLMGVTTYYIRFTFKKVFGVSVSDYINDLRLDFCKSQLLSTKLPVKKIYRTAGFSNYSYFFTLFKKNTGLTPNEFRFQKINI